MKTSEITEVVELVRELNDKIEDTADSIVPILALETNGYDVIINYLGGCIWSSEDDERDIVDDKPEDLRLFLINVINENSEAISQVKLK